MSIKNVFIIMGVFFAALLLGSGPIEANENPQNPQCGQNFSNQNLFDIDFFDPNGLQLRIDQAKKGSDRAKHPELKKAFEHEIKYLTDIKKKLPGYFENKDGSMNIPHIIMFFRKTFKSAILEAQLECNSCANWVFLSNTAVMISPTIINLVDDNDLEAKEQATKFGDEMKNRGMQWLEELIIRYPKNPMPYLGLARAVSIHDGNDKYALELVHKCLDVDKNNKQCLDLLSNLREGK